MDRAERGWTDETHDRGGTEGWLLRNPVRDVDQRVLPPPAQLVEIGQTQSKDACDGSLRLRIGRGEDRQARAFRGANQNRLLCRSARGEIGKRLVVARFIFA